MFFSYDRNTGEDKNDDDSDDEKGSVDKSLELSSDSELSLGDEPLMEIQVSSFYKISFPFAKYYKTTTGIKLCQATC